jgi:hypothetical protein
MNTAGHVNPPRRHTFVVRTADASPEVSVRNVATGEHAQLASLQLLIGQLERWMADAGAASRPVLETVAQTAVSPATTHTGGGEK